MLILQNKVFGNCACQVFFKKSWTKETKEVSQRTRFLRAWRGASWTDRWKPGTCQVYVKAKICSEIERHSKYWDYCKFSCCQNTADHQVIMAIFLRSEHWKQLGGAVSMKYVLWWQASFKLLSSFSTDSMKTFYFASSKWWLNGSK